MEACSLLVNLRKGMQSSEQPLVGEERYVTTLITAAKETTFSRANLHSITLFEFLFCTIDTGKPNGSLISLNPPEQNILPTLWCNSQSEDPRAPFWT